MALTYKKSGVDIDKGSSLVEIIKPLARATFNAGVMGSIGSFGALYSMKSTKVKDPVLVSSTDGVGTKLKIAFDLNKHDTVGIDLVAMCVNDILTNGARPLFFLDYFATGKLSTEKAADVIKGIAAGCRMADCALVGGETAEMPGFYSPGEYDLAGFSVGVVDRKKIINGSKIKDGDIIIGLSSSGLHSNGYSLARKLFFGIKKYSPKKKIKELSRPVGEELLTPTKIYVKSILKIINTFDVKGMAHITGGGITENLPRIFPPKKVLKAVIKKGSWPVHAIYDLIQREGKVTEDEMYKTFNMGIGFMLVIDKSDSCKVMRRLKSLGEEAYIIGEIAKGRGGVKYI
ncbi:MAG: phosphoribosylformylglycinamidine cyclo-ligase [Thermodesulfovibrionia bacterium]|nr:phosphoribosylformylglycinamidine cyclo-ligase [Thermodesulfovibrionia bacterium]